MATADKPPLSPASSPSPPAAAGGPVVPSGKALLLDKWLAIVFLSLFSALLASFPARNSDLWMHLAAGRDLAQGQSPFGTTSPWSADAPVNQNWLYDLVTYVLYAGLGGR